jgi:hypothetical protein
MLAHATIHLGVEVSGGAGGAFLVICHHRPPLHRLATINVVGILYRQFAVLNGLTQFGNGFRVFMAFMHHVIAKARVVVNGATWNNRKDVVFVFFGIGLHRV